MKDQIAKSLPKVFVTSYVTVDFPSLNWGINKGDTRELPNDEAARSIILATRGITLTK